VTSKGRRKAAIYAVILVLGLLAGFTIRAKVDRTLAQAQLDLSDTDRVTVMTRLFEAFCIGALRGKPLGPSGFLLPHNLQGNPIWVETGTDLFVALDLPQRCSVSDALRPLSPSEKTRLANTVDNSIPTWTPELSPSEPDDIGFFVLKGWTTRVDESQPRWGIVMYQAEETGTNAYTEISLTFPHE
jgi:hypothetical protein